MVPPPGLRLTSQSGRHARADTVLTITCVTGTGLVCTVRASTGSSVTAGLRAAARSRTQGFRSGGRRATACPTSANLTIADPIAIGALAIDAATR